MLSCACATMAFVYSFAIFCWFVVLVVAAPSPTSYWCISDMESALIRCLMLMYCICCFYLILIIIFPFCMSSVATSRFALVMWVNSMGFGSCCVVASDNSMRWDISMRLSCVTAFLGISVFIVDPRSVASMSCICTFCSVGNVGSIWVGTRRGYCHFGREFGLDHVCGLLGIEVGMYFHIWCACIRIVLWLVPLLLVVVGLAGSMLYIVLFLLFCIDFCGCALLFHSVCLSGVVVHLVFLLCMILRCYSYVTLVIGVCIVSVVFLGEVGVGGVCVFLIDVVSCSSVTIFWLF